MKRLQHTKERRWSNEWSQYDRLVLIRAYLRLCNHNSAYKVTAADADRSNDVSAVDLVELRKLILTVWQVTKQYPWTKNWNHTISQTSHHPGASQEQIDIKPISGWDQQRFQVWKVGDVNGTVTPTAYWVQSKKWRRKLEIKVKITIKSGEETTVEFKAENFNSIEGYQFSLALKGLDVKGIPTAEYWK